MKKLLLILVLLCTPVMAQDYIATMDSKSAPAWNDQLRQLRDRLSALESDRSIYVNAHDCLQVCLINGFTGCRDTGICLKN